jgi:hypothetical protein
LLAGCWRVAGGLLAGCWRVAGGLLAGCGLLVAGFENSGIIPGIYLTRGMLRGIL